MADPQSARAVPAAPAEPVPATAAPARGLSIRVKLAILIGGFVVVVTTIYAGATYQTVRRSSVAEATSRLLAVTGQLEQLLETSRSQLVKSVRVIADSPAVRAYALEPTAARRAGAQAALRPLAAPLQQIAAVELWSPAGRRLLAFGDTSWSGVAPDTALWRLAAGADSGVVGTLRTRGDSVGYEIVAPVRVGGRMRGYVVEWRELGPAQSRDINRLIGLGAELFVGNATNDLWSDFSRRVPAPPVDVRRSTGVLRYERSGAAVFAAARAVPKTPWVVLLEFSQNEALAPARQLLGRLMLSGAVILVLGLVATWTLSAKLTRPLARLTHVTEAMAAGDYEQSTGGGGRPDELGRLATAFDVMVAHVRVAQQRLEERVRARTAELVERNEELEAFGYSISHDLRSPLRAIQGFSQLLVEDHGEQLGEAGRALLQRVIAGARMMDRLIDDLLEYSRLARSELQLAPLDLRRVVDATLEQVDGDVRSRGARITVLEPLPTVVGHNATLVQVLVNLVGNGMKFVPKDRPPEVGIRAETKSGRVRLWIEDNGIGVAPEYHERIFGVFERLHRATDYPGTGIGLAIVRKAVERMGGRVGVESALGKGSRFWVELAASDAAAAAAN
jgi:signal transduction histidine kinase